MSSRLIMSIVVSFLFIVFTSELQSDNGRAGYTGSAGETKCNNCHSSYALNSGGGSVVLTSSMINWQYEPGYTYDMTLTVSRTGNNLFGMGLEALTTTNTNAGVLTVTNNHTQIKTKTVSNVVRNNMVHTLNGGASSNSMAFTFKWVAPTSNIGNVTMYFCGVAANGNGNSNLDYVYSGTQLITPINGTGISDALAQDFFTVYPNPASGLIHIKTGFPGEETAKIKLIDPSGKEIREMNTEGKNEITLDVSAYDKGIYYLSAENGGHRQSTKILIQ